MPLVVQSEHQEEQEIIHKQSYLKRQLSHCFLGEYDRHHEEQRFVSTGTELVKTVSANLKCKTTCKSQKPYKFLQTTNQHSYLNFKKPAHLNVSW
ncbi:hypothetical protein HanIR_Chr16g0841951 [Helianthus annuus]|nr:hypothetical protein HanIR_Chr16g0841951 [Helianthus annuus]